MKYASPLFAFLVLFPLTACQSPDSDDQTSAEAVDLAVDTATSEDALVSSSVAGRIPTGLPARLTVGLFENKGQTWMRSSGVPWNVRYAYFTKGWVNNWGWSAYDGSFALEFFQESAAGNFIPAVAYYQMNDEPGGGEGEFYAKTKNATTMRSYFSDFKILLQRVKQFGKPVILMIEADGSGYMQSQSGNNPNAYSAVAATGLPELAGLPNTVAGWGQAFLALRKSVGASNAILGMHVSNWASGVDVGSASSVNLQAEVDKVYAFLKPLGLGSNAIGATYDLLIGDPLDRDADYYRLVRGVNRWWDPSLTASLSSLSFNRYAEWLRLWNVKSAKRWVLWQIPLGNSSHLNKYNDGSSRAGYKDNRAEYFFGNTNPTRLEKFASSGVISLMFGAGATGQSSYTNDYYSDGQLFMKSRAGAFLKAGGLAIPSGTTTSSSTSTSPDYADYNFEAGAQGWSTDPTQATTASSGVRAQAGVRSLAFSLATTRAKTVAAKVSSPKAYPGAVITFRVWLPSTTRITSVQPYVLQDAAGGWRWTGNLKLASSLTPNTWNTFTVTVPSGASALAQLGVEIATNTAYTGTVYIDAVNWK